MKTYIVCLSVILSVGCTRPDVVNQSASTVSILTPQKNQISAKLVKLNETLPENKSYCFAVSVKGPGLEESTGSLANCQATLGLSAGFVLAGEPITFSIPKGTARNFELYLYLAEPGTICPSFSSDFFSTEDAYLRSYKVGGSAGINLTKDEESVEIILDFRGITQNLIADLGQSTCQISKTPDASDPVLEPEVPVLAPALKAMLYADGSIVQADNQSNILSVAWIESFFTLVADVFNLETLGVFGTANNFESGLNFDGSLVIPPYLHSVSRDPSNGNLYALDESGNIYLLKQNGAAPTFVGVPLEVTELAATQLDSSNCPFSACQLPMWVQSISVGRSGKLYILDHAGQIYESQAAGLVLLADAVSPAVTQILYY